MLRSCHSLGGLWPDSDDALTELDRRIASGLVDPADAERIRHWIAHGWVVIDEAVAPQVIDAYQTEFRELITRPSSDVMLFNNQMGRPELLQPDLFTPEASPKVLDHYVWSEGARRVLFSEPVMQFLSVLFDGPGLLFQSLGFEYGSRQGIHQDTAYVVVEPPLNFVGVWIALEDITEGSGELEYYDRSHRIPHFLFDGSRKHWIPTTDGPEGHGQWLRHLQGHAEELGLPRLRFRPKKGSILFWHADLAHGGAQVENETASRRSLVGHYCPASATPFYFRAVPERARRSSYGRHFYSSYYYALGG